MKPNALKRAWNDGRSTINGWLSVGNSYTAEVMAERLSTCGRSFRLMVLSTKNATMIA